MTVCAYPGCENEADKTHRCGECGDYFCAMHIYQSGGYICKTHFEAFVEPSIDSLKASAHPFQNPQGKIIFKTRLIQLFIAASVVIVLIFILSNR